MNIRTEQRADWGDERHTSNFHDKIFNEICVTNSRKFSYTNFKGIREKNAFSSFFATLYRFITQRAQIS